MSPIHPAAGEGFSRGALAYAQGGPDYPAALLPWLRSALLLNEHSFVADLGAGKFTNEITVPYRTHAYRCVRI